MSMQDNKDNKSKENEERNIDNITRCQLDVKDKDFYYYDAYGHFQTQMFMLMDSIRTKAYQKAIEGNPHLFKDKIVLDIGCGSGILSMFAAKAGAKKVYAIEASGIIDWAKIFINDNKLQDIIEPIKCKVEELVLPVDKVDIIISEWMGYFLLVESMLETVLYARDKWLVKDGLMFPDYCDLYTCGIDGQMERLDYWDDVYGFNFEPLKELSLKEGVNQLVDSDKVITNPSKILHLNLYTATVESLSFKSPFSISMLRSGYCFGLCCYFTVTFSTSSFPHSFSTGPMAIPTHWKQTQFYFRDPTNLLAPEQKIEGEMEVRKGKNDRDLIISVNITVPEKIEQDYVCHVLTRRY